MAFENKEIYDVIRILTLLLITLPFAASTNINCDGKSFHCVNSTHFMICVDLGSVSSTIDEFVIQCPPTTECQATNRFECEFPSTTATNIITSVSSAAEHSETTVSDSFITITPYQVGDARILDNNIESPTKLQNNADKFIQVTLYAEILTTESTKIAEDITLQSPLRRQDGTDNNKLTDFFDLSKEFNVTSEQFTNQEAMTTTATLVKEIERTFIPPVTKTDSRVPFVSLGEERVALDPSLNIDLLENSVKDIELTAGTTYDTTETQISTHESQVTTESAITTALITKDHNSIGNINTNVSRDSLSINMSFVNDTKQDELMSTTTVNLKIDFTNFKAIEPRLYKELSTENSIATTSKAIEGMGMEVMPSTTSLNIFTDDNIISTIYTGMENRPSAPSDYNPSETTTSVNTFKDDKTFSTVSTGANRLLTPSNYNPSGTITSVNIFEDKTLSTISTDTEKIPLTPSNFNSTETTTSVNIYTEDNTFSTISTGTEKRPSTPSNDNPSETIKSVNIFNDDKTFSTIGSGTEKRLSTPSNYNPIETITSVNISKADKNVNTVYLGTEISLSTPSNYKPLETEVILKKNILTEWSSKKESNTTTNVKNDIRFTTVSVNHITLENLVTTENSLKNEETAERIAVTTLDTTHNTKLENIYLTSTAESMSTAGVNFFDEVDQHNFTASLSNTEVNKPMTTEPIIKNELTTELIMKNEVTTEISTVNSLPTNNSSNGVEMIEAVTSNSVKTILYPEVTPESVVTTQPDLQNVVTKEKIVRTTLNVEGTNKTREIITPTTTYSIPMEQDVFRTSTLSNYEPDKTSSTVADPSLKIEVTTKPIIKNEVTTEIATVNSLQANNISNGVEMVEAVTSNSVITTLYTEVAPESVVTTQPDLQNVVIKEKIVRNTLNVEGTNKTREIITPTTTYSIPMEQDVFRTSTLSNYELDKTSSTVADPSLKIEVTTKTIINNEVTTEISTVNSLQANNISNGVEMVEAVTSNSVKTTLYTEVAPESVVTTQPDLQNVVTKDKIVRTTLNVKGTNKTREIMTPTTTYSISMEEDVFRTSTLSNDEPDKTSSTVADPSLKIEVTTKPIIKNEVTTEISTVNSLQANNISNGVEMVEAVTSNSVKTILYTDVAPESVVTTQPDLLNVVTKEKIVRTTLNVEGTNKTREIITPTTNNSIPMKQDVFRTSTLSNYEADKTSSTLADPSLKIEVTTKTIINNEVTTEISTVNSLQANNISNGVEMVEAVTSNSVKTILYTEVAPESVVTTQPNLQNVVTKEKIVRTTLNVEGTNKTGEIITPTTTYSIPMEQDVFRTSTLSNYEADKTTSTVADPSLEIEVTTKPIIKNEVTTEISTVNSLQANNISNGVEMVEAVTSNSVKTTLYTEVAPESVVTTQPDLQNVVTKEKIVRTTLNVEGTNKTEEIMTPTTNNSIPMEQDVFRTSTLSNYEADKTSSTLADSTLKIEVTTKPIIKNEVTTEIATVNSLQANNISNGVEMVEAVTSNSVKTTLYTEVAPESVVTTQPDLQNVVTKEKIVRTTLNVEGTNKTEEIMTPTTNNSIPMEQDVFRTSTLSNYEADKTSSTLADSSLKIEVTTKPIIKNEVTTEIATVNSLQANNISNGVEMIEAVTLNSVKTILYTEVAPESVVTTQPDLQNVVIKEKIVRNTLNVEGTNKTREIITPTTTYSIPMEQDVFRTSTLSNYEADKTTSTVADPSLEIEVTTKPIIKNKVTTTISTVNSLQANNISNGVEMVEAVTSNSVKTTLYTEVAPESVVTTKPDLQNVVTKEKIVRTTLNVEGTNKTEEIITPTTTYSISMEQNVFRTSTLSSYEADKTTSTVADPSLEIEVTTKPIIKNEVTTEISTVNSQHDGIEMFNTSNILPQIFKESSTHVTTENLTTKSTSGYNNDDSKKNNTELNIGILYDTRKDTLSIYNGSNNTSDNLTVTERSFIPRNITTPGINDKIKMTLTKSSTIGSIIELIPTLTNDLNLNTKKNMDTYDNAITEPTNFDTQTTTESFLQESTLKYAVAWDKKSEMDTLVPKKDSKSTESTIDVIVNGLSRTSTQDTISSDISDRPNKNLIIEQSIRSDLVTQPPDLNKLEIVKTLSGTKESLIKIENKYLSINNSDSKVTTILMEEQASPQNTSDLNTKHYKVIFNGTNFQEKDDLNSRVKGKTEISEINEVQQSMIRKDEIKDNRQNQSISDMYLRNVSNGTVFQDQGTLESFQNDKLLIINKDPTDLKNVTYSTLNNKVFKSSAVETVKIEHAAISKKSVVIQQYLQGNVTTLDNVKTPKADKSILSINNLEILSTQTNTKSKINNFNEFNNTKSGINVNIYERDTSVSLKQNNKVENYSISIMKSLIKNESGKSDSSSNPETVFEGMQISAKLDNKLRTGSEKEINNTQVKETINVISTSDLTNQSEDLTTLSDKFMPNSPVFNNVQVTMSTKFTTDNYNTAVNPYSVHERQDMHNGIFATNYTQTSLTTAIEEVTLQKEEITPPPKNASTVKSEKVYLSEVEQLQLETAITVSPLVDKDPLLIHESSVDIMKNGDMKVQYDLKNVTGGTSQLKYQLDLNKPQKMQSEDQFHNISSTMLKPTPLETQSTINGNKTPATGSIQNIPKWKEHKHKIYKTENETTNKNFEKQIQADKEFINVLGTSDRESTSTTNLSFNSFDGIPTLVTLKNHNIKTDKIEIVTEVAKPISSDLLSLYDSLATNKTQDIIVPLSKNVSGNNENMNESRKSQETNDPTGGLIKKAVPDYAETIEKNKMLKTKNQNNVVSTTESVNKNNAERNKEIHLTEKYTEKLIVPSAITTTIGLSTNIEIKDNRSKIIPNVVNKSNTETLITQNKDFHMYGKSDTNEQSQITSASYSEDTVTETNIKHNINNNTKQKEEKYSSILQNKNEGIKYYCRLKNRGKYSDREDCQKFYICIGRDEPIVGRCPQNTVFSDDRKQCTKNLSHCTRQSEFRCMAQGRFRDILQDNIYYICVNNGNHFIRFKFQCHKGYFLNKTSVKCNRKSESESNLRTSRKSSEYSSNKSERKEESVKSKSKEKHKRNDENKSVHFDCESEGKFAHPNDCRKYYVCTTNKKSEFRRKRKKCDSDEVFHKDKKECVDADSYEC